MLIFRSNFSVFLSFNTQLTHLNASNLLNFDPSNRFLPIASQSWCSGVSKMATYIYICSKITNYETASLQNSCFILDPSFRWKEHFFAFSIF